MTSSYNLRKFGSSSPPSGSLPCSSFVDIVISKKLGGVIQERWGVDLQLVSNLNIQVEFNVRMVGNFKIEVCKWFFLSFLLFIWGLLFVVYFKSKEDHINSTIIPDLGHAAQETAVQYSVVEQI